MTVFAPLRLTHREAIGPEQLGRALCTEVAEQVPYWVAVLTPAERPLTSGSTLTPAAPDLFYAATFRTSTGSHGARVTMLAALGCAVSTWQANRCRGSSSGVLVDITDTAGTVYPVRIPSVGAEGLGSDVRAGHLLDDVARRLCSVPNHGRDYRLARHYRALASRSGAQIRFRDGGGGGATEPNTDEGDRYTLDIDVRAGQDGITVARVRCSADLDGVDELLRLWSEALAHLDRR